MRRVLVAQPRPRPRRPPADRAALLARRRQPLHHAALSVLEHRHLVGSGSGSGPGSGPDSGPVAYDRAHDIQEQHRARFLAFKALAAPGSRVDDAASRPRVDAASACPRPLLLSFQCLPTYTLGRRQDDPSPAQAARLRQPLAVAGRSHVPDVRKTSRGGLTTYHGPGQLVLWPVVDMHSPLHPRYGVASYAAHLEATTRRLLLTRFGIATRTLRDEPGVWVLDDAPGPPRKIAALGVHHRRHVTALGLALNMDVPVAGDERSNPWARFVPCGLDGKAVTSVAAETRPRLPADWDPAGIAREWASLFEEGLLDESKRLFDGAAAR